MKKFKNFLNQTSEISNKDRLVIVGCTLGLYAIAMWRNNAALKAELELIDTKNKLDEMTEEMNSLLDCSNSEKSEE